MSFIWIQQKFQSKHIHSAFKDIWVKLGQKQFTFLEKFKNFVSFLIAKKLTCTWAKESDFASATFKLPNSTKFHANSNIFLNFCVFHLNKLKNGILATNNSKAAGHFLNESLPKPIFASNFWFIVIGLYVLVNPSKIYRCRN